jgi:conjugative relaxase-like TrwC/TraI family protein
VQTLAPCGARNAGRRPGGPQPRWRCLVLSRGKLTPGTVSYYTDTVARGLEDYYTGRGEAPGRWVGTRAAVEGLDGEVSGGELSRLFADGVHPRTGESLGAGYVVRDGVDKVLGWDLTFSAPKSVSVLWALAGGEVGMEVRDAHDAAVAVGLAYLEEHAGFARAGKAGIRQVDTDGLVGAAFVHRSSRAGDPQLHTHVLVSGRVRCRGDGVWRALDSRGLHPQLKPAGMVYQAALRAELTARLGVQWTAVDRNGQADILGVPRRVRTVFSKRALVVEARARELIAVAEAELGRPLSDAGRRRIFKVAVLETRPAKPTGVAPAEGLFDRWRAEAVAAGHHPDRWLGDVLDRRPEVRSLPVDVEVDAVVAELQQQHSTWTRRDVIRVAARRAPLDAGDAEYVHAWIETVADRVLTHPAVLGLAAPELSPPTVLRRRDGQSVFEHHGAARYTTAVTLAVEQQVLDIVTAGRNAGRGVAEERAVGDAVDAAGLGADQAAAVHAVSLNGDTVSCVLGPAGAGKSRMMGAAAQAWAASRIPVRGLAVSAAAAGVLHAETGMPADTIAKFLHEQDRPGGPHLAWRARRGEVLVIDEASMVASADLARLVLLTERVRGKVVLVGDWAQLGAVDAGGLFRLLAADDAAELTAIRRFRADWEQAASLRLRARDPAVLAVYEEHGRVVGGDRDVMLDTAFTRWQAARGRGESILVCAGDHGTVDTLALRCRTARVAAGEVEPDGLAVSEHVIGVGDEIVTGRNDRRLITTGGGWVRNGDRWTVTARHPDGTLTVEDASGRGRLTLPAGYVDDHVTLGYAVTIHKAQGVTVDHAVVVVDDTTTAEGLYVAMTRGRHTNTALVATDGDTPEHGPAPPPPTAGDVLGAALRRVSAERTAIEELRERLAASESLATLKPRLTSIDAWIHHHAPPDHTGELDRLAARRDHIASLRPGRFTREGRDLRKLVHTLDQQVEQLQARQQHRLDWLECHGDLFAYRDQLAAAADTRRHELGRQAVQTQPEHLVRLLGPVPDDEPARTRVWAERAARIEGYREEWGIEPDQLTTSPVDGIQHRHWEAAGFRELELARRLDTPVAERSLDRSLGIEL